MTTIQQQISLIEDLRESLDNSQREYITAKYSPSQLANLLRDIHENLLAVKLLQVNQPVPLCSDCNQPIQPGKRVAYAVVNDKIIIGSNEQVCERCTLERIKNLNPVTP